MRDASQSVVLKSPHLAASLSDRGLITRIGDRVSGISHVVATDAVRVHTDAGVFDASSASLMAGEADKGTAVFRRRFEGVCDLSLSYRLTADRAYLERRVGLANVSRRLVLLRVEFGAIRFASPPQECVDYPTFKDCPTVAFLRWPGHGIFAGIENPFFETSFEGGAFRQSFEPSLILEPGESYESEPQFVGVYRRSGVMIADHPPRTSAGQRPRFGNPCGHIPLDRSEIRAMQQFALDYLDVQTRRFHFILYNFFYPLPQMPAPGSPEEAVHLKMIDTFHDLGGDLIILNPMFPYVKPDGRMNAHWELGPEGSAAKAIMDHAARKGIGFGYYMGCARHGGEGNACALPFAPEKKDWKKVDDEGHAAGENCMACDGFAEWWYAVQRNTISRYNLKLWSWDPGPGNGLFCHSDRHGHLPGKGGYKGWRNATEVMRRLKQEFPGIYFQAFYGRKEHGIWGFKYFDQHESYWEVSLMCSSSMHPELHADRMNSDGIRQQSWWNQTFRFHPPQLSHSMTHRQQEGVWDPRLVKVWDHIGWKYSLMSTLAACGSVLVTILPEDHSTVPGMREFYAKWLKWARDHYDYVPYSVPFGAQVRPGGVDGWARIKGAHGFIFLCNPGPRPARAVFTLDDEIGLSAQGSFALTELYPIGGRVRADAANGHSVFAAGERVSLVVPAHEVVLLELAQAGPRPAAVAARRAAASTLPRALDDWRLPGGSRFAFPRHTAAGELVLETAFDADPRIRDLLAAARPSNLAEFEAMVPKWKREYPDNFAWARPDRLWLALPLVDADKVDEITLAVNGSTVPVECHTIQRKVMHYADITDAVRWGSANTLRLGLRNIAADQFMGPYLDYPQDDPAAEEASAEAAAVIYDGPLDPEPPPRVRTGPADSRRAPVVVSVQMSPAYLRDGVETRFSAVVDMAPDELEGVYITGPWHDERMALDAATGHWTRSIGIGGRSGLIMDLASYHVWAVAKNGLVSNRKRVDLAWKF